MLEHPWIKNLGNTKSSSSEPPTLSQAMSNKFQYVLNAILCVCIQREDKATITTIYKMYLQKIGSWRVIIDQKWHLHNHFVNYLQK